jgi:hypothetical protein
MVMLINLSHGDQIYQVGLYKDLNKIYVQIMEYKPGYKHVAAEIRYKHFHWLVQTFSDQESAKRDFGIYTIEVVDCTNGAYFMLERPGEPQVSLYFSHREIETLTDSYAEIVRCANNLQQSEIQY